MRGAGSRPPPGPYDYETEAHLRLELHNRTLSIVVEEAFPNALREAGLPVHGCTVEDFKDMIAVVGDTSRFLIHSSATPFATLSTPYAHGGLEASETLSHNFARNGIYLWSPNTCSFLHLMRTLGMLEGGHHQTSLSASAKEFLGDDSVAWTLLFIKALYNAGQMVRILKPGPMGPGQRFELTLARAFGSVILEIPSTVEQDKLVINTEKEKEVGAAVAANSRVRMCDGTLKVTNMHSSAHYQVAIQYFGSPPRQGTILAKVGTVVGPNGHVACVPFYQDSIMVVRRVVGPGAVAKIRSMPPQLGSGDGDCLEVIPTAGPTLQLNLGSRGAILRLRIDEGGITRV